MTAAQAQARTFTGNAGKAKGKESLDEETGERHYTSYSPFFSVHYYPRKEPEVVHFKIWEDEYIYTGHDLLEVYEDLKTMSFEVIKTTTGPREVGKPYIEKIEYRQRL